MLGTNEMDGVNGITQCPISEDDAFTYKFRLQQYGHSWYHSHYSSQYSDGVAAPLLIHGPTTADWDEEWAPIIVTDWHHQSAFDVFHLELSGTPPPASSILVNGTGKYYGNKKSSGEYFQQTFEPGKRYLIRLVNGATDFHYQFSIDNHNFTVVSADFVPIVPYVTDNISVGIGQRFSIIVEAKPITASSNGKYWLRTEYTTADGCNFNIPSVPANKPDLQRTGIISYSDAGEGEPTTERHPTVVRCDDENYSPRVKWTVTAPQNNISKDIYHAGNDRLNPSHGFLRWELAETPLWINFSDPTILNLDNTTWKPSYAVEEYNYTKDTEFVYMVINSGDGTKDMFAGHHPIHLHGHDVAVIAQGPGAFDPLNPNFNLDNPPRRDVAMLPNKGHLVIAFRSDNPGVWLIHCHIAWHAGSGLALQIIERQGEIEERIGSLSPVREGCSKWDNWMATHTNVWNEGMQEDSGI